MKRAQKLVRHVVCLVSDAPRKIPKIVVVSQHTSTFHIVRCSSAPSCRIHGSRCIYQQIQIRLASSQECRYSSVAATLLIRSLFEVKKKQPKLKWWSSGKQHRWNDDGWRPWTFDPKVYVRCRMPSTKFLRAFHHTGWSALCFIFTAEFDPIHSRHTWLLLLLRLIANNLFLLIRIERSHVSRDSHTAIHHNVSC